MVKPIALARDVLPIAKFKARASEMIQRVRQDKHPLVITLNGAPAAVLIAVEDYDRRAHAASVREGVDEGLGDVREGRVVSDDELGRWADAKFGKVPRAARRR